MSDYHVGPYLLLYYTGYLSYDNELPARKKKKEKKRKQRKKAIYQQQQQQQQQLPLDSVKGAAGTKEGICDGEKSEEVSNNTAAATIEDSVDSIEADLASQVESVLSSKREAIVRRDNKLYPSQSSQPSCPLDSQLSELSLDETVTDKKGKKL